MGNLHNPQREAIDSILHRGASARYKIWPSGEPSESWCYSLDDGRKIVLLGISEQGGFNPPNRERVAVFVLLSEECHQSQPVSRRDVDTCHFAVVLRAGEERLLGVAESGRIQLFLLEPSEVLADCVIFKENKDAGQSYNPIIGASG